MLNNLLKFYVCPIVAALVLSGCASVDRPDPFESYNRKMFAFNMTVDKAVIRPVAKVYDTVTPNVVQHGISNVLSNIYQIPTIANDILQANPGWALADIMRLVVNTTFGIGGLFDVAKPWGLEPHDQGFGLTLAKWGYRDSAYFVFPLLPPATIRDLLGLGVDSTVFSIWTYVGPDWWAYTAAGANFIVARAQLLSSDKLIYEALDPYVFVRDVYLQRIKVRIEKVKHPDQVDNAEQI